MFYAHNGKTMTLLFAMTKNLLKSKKQNIVNLLKIKKPCK